MRSPDVLDLTLTVEQLWQRVPGGSGTYIRELAVELARRDDVTLTGVRARGTGDPDRRGLPPSMALIESRVPRALLYQAWTRLRRPRVPGRRPDLIHATTWAIPPRTAPLVVTIQDVAFRRNPEYFTPHGVAFFERALTVARREADVVIVPSLTTRDDVVAAGFDPERIHLAPLGVRAPTVHPERVAAFRTRHGLTRPYVMWCGAVEPRKNLGMLLEAFGRLVGDTDLDLVLVGPDGWGGAAEELRTRRAALPTDRVHVLGNLGRIELHDAYAAARVFCFPSLWEGFGLPVLEAQSHGVPVVTSRGTSTEEVGGDGAILIDPHDADDIAAAIRAAIGDRHDELAAAATANTARYTWERTAHEHVVAYRTAIQRASA